MHFTEESLLRQEVAEPTRNFCFDSQEAGHSNITSRVLFVNPRTLLLIAL